MTITVCRVCNRSKTVMPWRLSNILVGLCDICAQNKGNITVKAPLQANTNIKPVLRLPGVRKQGG